MKAHALIPKPVLFLSFFATGLFFCLGLLVPLAALLARVVMPSGISGETSGFIGTFTDPVVLSVAGVTLKQAVASTLLSLLIGTPLGLWVGAHARRGAGQVKWAHALLAMPFGVPTVVAGLVWVGLLGRSGILSRLGWQLDWAYSLRAVILAHVFYNAPWVALWVAQVSAQIPSRLLDAARTLGAGGWARFRFVIFPALKWTLASTGAQVLALCAMSFALVLILGGGPPVETLETALYSRIRYGSLDLPGAIACASWELILTLVPWLVFTWVGTSRMKNLEQSAVVQAEAGDDVGLNPHPRMGVWTMLGVCALWVLPYLLFLAATPWKVLMREEIFQEIRQPLFLSLVLALSSAGGVIVFTGAAILVFKSLQFRKKLKTGFLALLALPSGISILVLGLGFWLAYSRWIDPFEGSLPAIIALQVTLFFPIAFRSLWPLAQSSQGELFDAARTLGASPLRAFWYVEWPRWRLPLVSAFAIVAAASLGEVAAVSLFFSEKLIPLPLLVSRWSGQYRFDEAWALAALLMALSMALMMASAQLTKLGRPV